MFNISEHCVKLPILFSLLSPTIVLAQQEVETCPILYSGMVYNTIQTGSHWSAFWNTLSIALNLPPDEVIKREPTANPYDTFHNIWSVEVIGNIRYLIMTSDFLAQNIDEARSRATAILFNDLSVWKTGLTGHFDAATHSCIYKDFQASPNTPNYPFKSAYEHIKLTATDMDYVMPGGNGG